MNLNKIVIIGRLTRDPELKSTNAGTSVCNFSVAVDRTYRDKEGNRPTDFFDISVFGATAEFVAKYFKKGSSIAVSGAMESRKFVDKDGNNRIAWSLHADEVNFCGSKSENNGGSQKPSIDEGYSGDPVESDDVLF
ncbi:single-stranded DNA-binding protein [Butyricicoccus sp. AM28-25]|nr:single-stranded DNA-binding protein [Butyricicoccus sp. AM28-25]